MRDRRTEPLAIALSSLASKYYHFEVYKLQGTLKGFEKNLSIFRNVNFLVAFMTGVIYYFELERVHIWRYLASFGGILSYLSKAVFGVAI